MRNRLDTGLFRQGKAKQKHKEKMNLYPQAGTFGDFICAHCKAHVSASSLVSGVIHRNHCPYCLWSRHLDQHQAGDRRSVCKAPMRPVGLALKRERKKYGAGQGELMLVHCCVDCGRLSANRMAADDDLETVLAVFQRSTQENGILADLALLRAGDADLVRARLFGRSPAIELGSDGRESRMEALLAMWDA